VLADGNIESEWPLERAIAIGDKATGVPVLHDLYDQMKATPVTVDLDGLWKKLGVKELNGHVVTSRLRRTNRHLLDTLSQSLSP
jgi:hypothetical protein